MEGTQAEHIAAAALQRDIVPHHIFNWISGNEFIFDEKTLWCNMEEYYELTNKWYDIAEVDIDEWLDDSSYDTFENLETSSSYVKPFKGITWLILAAVIINLRL